MMKITELIDMLELLPKDTPLLNTPCGPHHYVKDNTSLGLSVGSTIFNQNPPTKVGEFILFLKNICIGFQITNKLYLTSNSYQVGQEVEGIKMTLDGIRLLGTN